MGSPVAVTVVGLMALAAQATGPSPREVATQETYVREWEKAREIWSKELQAKEQELKVARDAIDIDKRVERIEKGAVDLAKMGTKGVADALAGKREQAGLAAAKMVREFAEMKKAEGEIIDIAGDAEKQARVSSLAKAVGQLQKDVAVADAVIAKGQAALAAMQKEATAAAWSEMTRAVGHAMQEANARREARREAERKEAQRKAEARRGEDPPGSGKQNYPKGPGGPPEGPKQGPQEGPKGGPKGQGPKGPTKDGQGPAIPGPA